MYISTIRAWSVQSVSRFVAFAVADGEEMDCSEEIHDLLLVCMCLFVVVWAP